jgi:phage terminase Nu1 subunit (DNA packaging protein)
MVKNTSLVSTSQLSDILQVTRQAIYKWRKNGMPVVVDNSGRQGKTIRYDYDEVIDWLNEKKKKRERIVLEDMDLEMIDPYET